MTRCTSSALTCARRPVRRVEGRSFASRWIYRSAAADYLRTRWWRSRAYKFLFELNVHAATYGSSGKRGASRKTLSEISKGSARACGSSFKNILIIIAKLAWEINLLKLFWLNYHSSAKRTLRFTIELLRVSQICVYVYKVSISYLAISCNMLIWL